MRKTFDRLLTRNLDAFGWWQLLYHSELLKCHLAVKENVCLCPVGCFEAVKFSFFLVALLISRGRKFVSRKAMCVL
jgi:hypothetical protein